MQIYRIGIEDHLEHKLYQLRDTTLRFVCAHWNALDVQVEWYETYPYTLDGEYAMKLKLQGYIIKTYDLDVVVKRIRYGNEASLMRGRIYGDCA